MPRRHHAGAKPRIRCNPGALCLHPAPRPARPRGTDPGRKWALGRGSFRIGDRPASRGRRLRRRAAASSAAEL